jgi:hypothetical protein
MKNFEKDKYISFSFTIVKKINLFKNSFFVIILKYLLVSKRKINL